MSPASSARSVCVASRSRAWAAPDVTGHALSPRAKPCIRFGELDIRDPCLEELRTKTEDEVRAIEVVARDFASATPAIRRRTNGVVVERFVCEPARRAQRPQPPVDEPVERTGLESSEPGDSIAPL